MASIKLTGDTSGVITVSAPAVSGTNTITMPASTGTMALTSDITTEIPSQTGNSGKYLTTNGSASSWGTVASGGMTLLSTVATTSGTSIATGTLDLSTYKTLQVFIYNVGNTTSSGVLRWKETGNTVVQIAGTTGAAGTSSYGVLSHDLTLGVTGVMKSYTLADDLTFSNPGGSGSVGINTGIDTATTSITYDFSGGETFDKGTIKIYGIK